MPTTDGELGKRPRQDENMEGSDAIAEAKRSRQQLAAGCQQQRSSSAAAPAAAGAITAKVEPSEPVDDHVDADRLLVALQKLLAAYKVRTRTSMHTYAAAACVVIDCDLAALYGFCCAATSHM
jgi:hypothetical protein